MTEQEIDHYALKIFSEVSKEVFYSSLGEATTEAILFLLNRMLSRDPFEVLWREPKTFYREMEKVLGSGVKVLFTLLVSKINSRFGLNIDGERFLELMQSCDQKSIEELRSFIKKIAELYKACRGTR